MIDQFDGLEITTQISKVRDFLIASWPYLDLLMANHDWDEDPDFIDEWLQGNWEFFVEREVLGVCGGVLTGFSSYYLSKRVLTTRKGPLYSVNASWNPNQLVTDVKNKKLPQSCKLRFYCLSTAVSNGLGFGLYPPFDFADLVDPLNNKLFRLPFLPLKFFLEKIQ